MTDNVKLYSPNNHPIVDFDVTRATCSTPSAFKCSDGIWWCADDLHKETVVEVYVAGVRYENPDAPPSKRAVMEIRGEDIGKVTPDFYTVYTISNTDTPTRAESDHKKLDKAILAGGELAAKLGLPLHLRIAKAP